MEGYIKSVRVDEAMNAGRNLCQHGTHALLGEGDHSQRKLSSNTRQMASVPRPFAIPHNVQRRYNTTTDRTCTTEAKHFRSRKTDKLQGAPIEIR
jgi:hypothetical protein